MVGVFERHFQPARTLGWAAVARNSPTQLHEVCHRLAGGVTLEPEYLCGDGLYFVALHIAPHCVNRAKCKILNTIVRCFALVRLFSFWFRRYIPSALTKDPHKRNSMNVNCMFSNTGAIYSLRFDLAYVGNFFVFPTFSCFFVFWSPMIPRTCTVRVAGRYDTEIVCISFGSETLASDDQGHGQCINKKNYHRAVIKFRPEPMNLDRSSGGKPVRANVVYFYPYVFRFLFFLAFSKKK